MIPGWRTIRPAMNDLVWIGLVTALVFVYLLYALLVPEKF
ncbi:MAG: potassium-transporting ATPase subunit F [Myxococcota bacterium]